MAVEALIFDFDGLIVDTEVPIYDAWSETYAAFDQELPLATYAGCVGSDFGGFDPKTYLENQIGETIDWTKLDIDREAGIRDQVNQMGPMDGVEALLISAKEANLPCVVASSSTRNWVEGHLARIGFEHYFKLTRCRDDVSEIKPSPELFLAAAKAVGADSTKSIVFEDSLNGLKAAISAKSPCVAVPNPVTEHLDFSGAVRVLKSLEEISLDDLTELV